MSDNRARLSAALGLALLVGHAAPGESPAAEGEGAPGQDRPARTDRHGDPLPPGAIARLGTVRLRRLNGVRDVAFTPDSRLVASGGHTTLHLWDRKTGRLVRTLGDAEDPTYPFACYAFCPNGKDLVSGDGEGRWLYVWDVASGRQRRRLKGNECYMTALAIAPDGRTVACGGNAGTVWFWDVIGGKRLGTAADSGRGVDSLAFTADGRHLAVLDREGDVRLLEAPAGKVCRRLALGSFARAALAPDGRTVATFAFGGGLWLWEVASGQKRRLLADNREDLYDLSFSPDGRALLAADRWLETLQLWDVAGGKQVRRVRLPGLTYRQTQGPLALSPDGATLATAEDHSVVRLWDARTGRPLDFAGHTNPPSLLAFSADGRTLTSFADLDRDKELRRWRTATGRPLSRATPSRGDLDDCVCWRLSPAGDCVAKAVTPWVEGGRVIRLYDTKTGKVLHEWKGHSADVIDLAFSPDGETLAAAAKDGRLLARLDQTFALELWETASGRKVYRFPGPPDPGKPPAVLWEEMASADAARSWRALWQLADKGGAVAFLREHLHPVSRPDPGRLARLVRELDSPDFLTREKAAQTLVGFEGGAGAALEGALKGGVSLEVRRRAEGLLRRLRPRSPERLREVRAVQVLESVGTPEARRLLADLARGAPEARLTREAKASLQRLARRPAPKA